MDDMFQLIQMRMKQKKPEQVVMAKAHEDSETSWFIPVQRKGDRRKASRQAKESFVLHYTRRQ